MTTYNPDRSLGFLLYDAARLMRRDFDRRARSLGLTRAQWSVLAHLVRKEGSRQAAIADTLEIEPITLVRQLDRLEAAGWVERRPDPSDRRARLLYLTDKAHPVLDQLYALGAETRAIALADVSVVLPVDFLRLPLTAFIAASSHSWHGRAPPKN